MEWGLTPVQEKELQTKLEAKINELAAASPLFQNVPSGKDFYFVHSYHFCCRNEEDIIARTPYCKGFISAISKGHIFGTQFHPEKSQKLGFLVLKNFLSI